MKIYTEECRYMYEDESVGVYIEEPQIVAGQHAAYFIFNTDTQKPFTKEEMWFWRDELDADIAERITSCK